MSTLKQKKNNFFETIAKFIVEKRKLFYLIFFIAVVISAISIPNVVIEYDIPTYLPDDCDTKISVTIMEEEFYTYGTATVMVSNITYQDAVDLHEELLESELYGVKSILFEDSDDYYAQSCAKFVFTFEGEDSTDESLASITAITDALSEYDVSVQAAYNMDEYAATLMADISEIMIYVIIVIGIILVLSSKSYMEIPIFAIVFLVAAVLNVGTNVWFDSISFVSYTVGTILQLALAIDYAIILSHRFIEEKKHSLSTESAVIAALSKAIPEIMASSLTTIAGLVAMMFMQLQLGLDLGMVLTKGILFSLLSVFVLMPGLLVLCDKPLAKTEHRNFVPSFRKPAVLILKMRKIMPILFILLIAAALFMQTNVEYAFDQGSIDTDNPLESDLEEAEIAEVFGIINTMAILVPAGDYDTERAVIEYMLSMEEVTSAQGLSYTEITEGVYITDDLTIKEFADALGVDRDLIQLLYYAYALSTEDISVINTDVYTVNFLDMVDFMYEHVQKETISLDDETYEFFMDLYAELEDGRLQTQGENWSRLVFNINLPIEGEETYAFIETVKEGLTEFYDEAYLVGESTSSYDLYSSFTSDNLLITIITILFVLVILLFTFKSIGAPALLILIIQGSIFINFAIPIAQGNNIYFFSYLVVSAIQMGATIDYAIVITTRYQELKKTMRRVDAAVEAITQCFPTVMTSASIMTICGLLIGFIVSDPIVASIGMALGRGTIISLLSVLIILPQALVLTSGIIDKTKFDTDIMKQLGLDIPKMFKNSRVQITFDASNKNNTNTEIEDGLVSSTEKDTTVEVADND
ncbi:MAG: MMPL family transporter [Bacillota bacterium]